ncbi:MAG: FHA domain-containing protein [Pseudobutyrivibrio sp.]|nr:FHA domain-containing protein [Pseudobutyrivibrio sp.]
MKGFKKFLILSIAYAMAFLSLHMPVIAEEKLPSKEDAKAGVVQVNTVFRDTNGTKHVVCGGAGILIGDPENTEYIITCNHTVNPGDDFKYAAFEYLQISNENDAWSHIVLTAEVVVEGDVVIEASQVTSSPELDMAVLQLAQPIYTRKPLTILTAKDNNPENLPYKTLDSVFALGYPDRIGFDSGVQYFSNEQIVMTEGSIANLLSVNNVQMIEHDAGVDANNCGGPLVNEFGYVIGMNLLQKDGMYNCTLDSTKITKVLDGLGIAYSKVNDVPKPKVEEKKVEPPEENNHKQGLSLRTIIIICIVAVIVIAGIIALVILLVLRKDKTVEAEDTVIKTYNGAIFENNSSSLRGASGAFNSVGTDDETTILSGSLANNDETQILSGELQNAQNLGTLIRKRTSERIVINKNDFVIGKDALHSDFFIENNGSISRKHAVIVNKGRDIYIQDCNSTNGTFVNGTRINSGSLVLLNNGDVIKISNEEFEYQT